MYKKLIIAAVCAVLAAPAMAVVATFDWTGHPSDWSGNPIPFTDPVSGSTIQPTGRIFSNGGGYLFQTPSVGAAYGNAPQVGAFTIDGGATFQVQSFDIAMGGYGISGTMTGTLGGVPQWTYTYSPGVWNGVTMDDLSNPLSSFTVDKLDWVADTGTSWGNSFDNLVVIPEPATLSLLGLAAAAIFIKRRMS